ncbi:MAG TPA: ATP-binding cassette domain-containing protein [Solirubrobacteraceae bacterium]|nr:ATP-binding cassette domain-containing protein [Solirubrobacteraceae bacterium]
MSRWARSPLPWLGGLLGLYLLGPIAAFLGRLAEHGAARPAPGLGGALVTSLVTASISTVIIVALGVPLAYLLARARGRVAAALGVLVALPLALPPLMSGILLIEVVGPYTAIGRLFDGRLTDTPAGIVLAQTFVSAPFLVVAARSAFAAVDPALEDVAATLGHGRLARFVRVALPVAAPGIAAGALLAWLRAFGEFGATVILAYHPYSLPVYTYVQFSSTGLPSTIAPVAVALGAAAVLLVLTARPRRRSRRRAVRLPPPAAPIPSPAGPLSFRLSKRLGAFALGLEYAGSTRQLAILGPSGAGKTLTLRLLAGLEVTDAAAVTAGGQDLGGLAAERRGIGYVPQAPSLLPHRTVWQQVTFGVGADPALAAWWLDRLGLHGLESRLPEELSGGQQRRVALARALARNPRLLLLDEPFSALDAPVRDRLRRDLRRLQRDHDLATVLVTHDPEEAALLAQEVLVIDAGRLLQSGPWAAVFRHPASAQVAALLGIANTCAGVVTAPDRIACAGVVLRAPTGALPAGTPVSWCIRPECVRLGDDGSYPARLIDTLDLGTGHETLVQLAPGLQLTSRGLHAPAPALGADCRVELPYDDLTVWPAEEAPPSGRDGDPDRRLEPGPPRGAARRGPQPGSDEHAAAEVGERATGAPVR